MNHLTDAELLLVIEGQVPAAGVQKHLGDCWKCRARRDELEDTIAAFSRVHETALGETLPPADGPRALLRARLAELPQTAPSWRFAWPVTAAALLALGVLMGRMLMPGHSPHTAVLSIPDARLTPGATLLASRPVVCAQANTKNKPVPAALRRAVFEEYGIANADPRAYEVDYLVTPALGGADDIHNLWPHSYSSTVWNAPVKDALEDRMRDMVCDGSLDLEEAQREIAGNWIEAYKRYFHTDEPLPEHRK
jgi:hypothetical protein